MTPAGAIRAVVTGAPRYELSQSWASPVRPLCWATVAVLAAQVRLRYGVELDETHLLGLLANEVNTADFDEIVARINCRRTLLRVRCAQSAGDLTRVQVQVEHRWCTASAGGFRQLCHDGVCRDGLGPFAVIQVEPALDHSGRSCTDLSEPGSVAAFRVIGDRIKVIQAERHTGERVDVSGDNYAGHWLLDVQVIRARRFHSDCRDLPTELLAFKQRIAANLHRHEGIKSTIVARGEVLAQQAIQKRQARASQEAANMSKRHATARRASAADMSRRLYLYRTLCGAEFRRHSRQSVPAQRRRGHDRYAQARSRSLEACGGGVSGFVEYPVPVNSPELRSGSAATPACQVGNIAGGRPAGDQKGPAPWSPGRRRRLLSSASLN